jgi:hypothetical protein
MCGSTWDESGAALVAATLHEFAAVERGHGRNYSFVRLSFVPHYCATRGPPRPGHRSAGVPDEKKRWIYSSVSSRSRR